MRIESSDVQVSSQRNYLKVESAISTTGWVKESELEAPKNKSAAVVDLSAETANQLAEQAAAQKKANDKDASEVGKTFKAPQLQWASWQASNPQDVKIRLLEAMLYALTGKRIEAKQFSWGGQNNSQQLNLDLSGWLGGGVSQSEPLRQVTNVQQFQYESESLSYQAKGIVNTADGQSINVDVNMYMSREFVAYTSTSIAWAKPMDPLVINYAGTAASLTQQTFSFDLTMDGNMEQMHFAGPGSGFLAADWNGDGTINDGSELFGPQNGDGFAELRKYDADGNGWIDENDDIFSKLVVWSKDENGNDQLFTLQELGIGAIYLGDVDTEFSFMDEQNNAQGIMRSTSFFLKEDGGAGTIHHVDLMI